MTFNINALGSGTTSKLPGLLGFAELHFIAIIFLQETWLDRSAAPPALPSHWKGLFYNHPTQRIGRGLAILVRHDLFSARGFSPLSLLFHESSNTHDVLVASLGDLTLASVYIPHHVPPDRPNPTPTFLPLASSLVRTRPRPDSRMIVAGDWNFKSRHKILNRVMSRELDLVPLLPQGLGHTTHTHTTPRSKPSLLDNIFDNVGITLHIVEEVTDVYSPHSAVIGTLPFSAPSSSSSSLVSLRAPAPLLRKLPRFNRISIQPHRRGDEVVKEFIKQRDVKIEQAISAIPTSDLGSLLFDHLFPIAEKFLGASRPRSKPKTFMSSSPLHKLQKARARSRRSYLDQRSPTHNSTPTSRDRVLLKAFLRAQRAWIKAKGKAEREANMAILQRIGSGDMPMFFKAYNGKLHSKPSPSRNPPLDKEKVRSCFTTIYTPVPNLPHHPSDVPFTDVISFEFTDEMINEAIGATKPSAPGPDGFDFRFIRRFRKDLSPILARCFNEAIRHGVPAILRTALTILIPKDIIPSADDPLRYRPITLLCVLVRLLHKAIDLQLRTHLPQASRFVFADDAADPAAWQITLDWCQAGFLPARNCHEQAFLAHLSQSFARGFGASRKSASPLYGGFLDITQCFPSIDHGQLLHVLQTHTKLPAEWLEIIRRLITGNKIEIMGITIDLLRGLFQGSSLSPLLSLCFLDELVAVIKTYIVVNYDAIVVPWRGSPAPAAIAKHLLLLLLFADDLTLFCLDVVHSQAILSLIFEWGQRRGVSFSGKSIMVHLSGPRCRSALLPKFTLGDLSLRWANHAEHHIYLGHPLPPASFNSRFETYSFPLDSDTIDSDLRKLRRVFKLGKKSTLVHGPAFSMGVNQIIFAKVMYPCAVFDTDYKALDQLVLHHARRLFNLPKFHPSVSLRRELNLIHSDLLAKQRALRFAYFLYNYSWFGQLALQPLQASAPTHPLFSMGVLRRLTSHVTTMFPKVSSPWAHLKTLDKEEFAEALEHHIKKQFIARSDEDLVLLRSSIRPRHLSTLHLTMSPPNRCHLKPCCPLFYFEIGKDLAEAALRFKSISLRYFHDRKAPLPPCFWCKLNDVETGAHLVCCHSMPAALRTSRDLLLHAILSDHVESSLPADLESASLSDNPLATPNILRLLRASWGSLVAEGNKNIWRGDKALLIRALTFLRDLLNCYCRDSAPSDGSPNPISSIASHSYERLLPRK